VKETQSLFSGIVTSLVVFDNESECQNYLRKDDFCDTVFLIVGSDYEVSLITDFQQLPNVQAIYRYGQSSSSNETIIENYDDLCFRLTNDLIAHYNKLGSNYSAKQDAKAAKDMFMKVSELYDILAKL
jgi:hypothetical protein